MTGKRIRVGGRAMGILRWCSNLHRGLRLLRRIASTRERKDPDEVVDQVVAEANERERRVDDLYRKGERELDAVRRRIDDLTGRPSLRNDVLIRKNTQLPCQVTKTYYTMHHGQEVDEATVTQGAEIDVDFTNPLAKG